MSNAISSWSSKMVEFKRHLPGVYTDLMRQNAGVARKIEADSPVVGLVAFVGIGMDEVSTCEITVKEGQRIKKGEQTGMFHFGGSSHCVVFQKGVQVEGFPEMGRETNVPVRSKLAVVRQ